ncbi:uncharacterized protein LOC141536974 [Cotesia typhae]
MKLDILIEERDDMKLFIRKLLSLALLPENDIKKAFTCLLNDHKTLSELFKGLTNYFSSYWLKVIKPHRFSCYRNTIRTNNYLESYHRTLKWKLGSHPQIWEFTEGIAALQELTAIEKSSLENNLKIRRTADKKIVLKNEMIQYLWDLYDNGTLEIDNFLHCASHTSKAFHNNNIWTNIDDINNFLMPIE